MNLNALKYFFVFSPPIGRWRFFISSAGVGLFWNALAFALFYIMTQIQGPQTTAPSDTLQDTQELVGTLMIYFMIAALITFVFIYNVSSLSVRRLKDLSKPWWLILPVLVPYILAAALMLFFPALISFIQSLLQPGSSGFELPDNFKNIFGATDLLFKAANIYGGLLMLYLIFWPGALYKNSKPKD